MNRLLPQPQNGHTRVNRNQGDNLDFEEEEGDLTDSSKKNFKSMLSRR